MPHTSTADVLSIARRHLPHWEMGGSTYFITWRSGIGRMPDECLQIVKDRILAGHDRWFRLFAGVVMPDHVHLIIQPLPAQEPQIGRVTEYYSLSEIVKGIKGASARDINLVLGRRGPLWQDERWDRLLRNEHEYLEKYRYILYNPVKARLIEAFQEYPFYVFPPEVEAERRAFRLRG